MSEYIAPLQDMRLALDLAGLDEVVALPGYEDASRDVVDAMLEEAARLTGELLSPLNRVGDRVGASLGEDGRVTLPDGFQAAYRAWADNGWNGMGCDPAHGGAGMPHLVVTQIQEMVMGANMAFSLCPLLTAGAIEALALCGSEAQKALYLSRMVSGEWAGTMNLTEPQAGSDLAAVRTRAEPRPDGSWRLFGQKIFITFGEHELASNIVHLVLARTPGAPEGVKGLSLFIVPKFIPDADGHPGARNDLRCVSLEHKLGIHASPTCVMAYGDGEGATGWLCGEENRGIEYMFIMMNAARFAVGLQGIAVAERAWQRAHRYANERMQGSEAGMRGGGRVAIVRHPDVRRMLLRMKSQVDAMRLVAAVTAAARDCAARHPDPAQRAEAQVFVELMIPVVKGWSTETAVDIASLGVQVHGGMGYIEETGAAQYLRDARITTIYEGTTGIQANDLVGRKIVRDKGAAMHALVERMRALAASDLPVPLQPVARRFREAIDALERATGHVLATWGADMRLALAGAVPLLMLFGRVVGGWQLLRAALRSHELLERGDGDAAFLHARIVSARFYADHVLTECEGLARTVCEGSDAVLDEMAGL
ncbi:acyl-CoA dehydrogenase [Methyloversatilis thermotolerans]|uniref:acyl-CoA dehydrogenase n=1 Tax=Methyloversatilis thermotolerans TaxID=1346290 RepID=UPI00037206D2|nr:acyl-CoA dehydrogenase [Methyloversatilis thermotolerans]